MVMWDQSERLLLRAYQKARVGFARTAVELGRSVSAVRSQASAIGALQGYFVWTRDKDIRLEDLVAAGLRRKVIAARLGTTDGSVRQRMHRLGLRLT